MGCFMDGYDPLWSLANWTVTVTSLYWVAGIDWCWSHIPSYSIWNPVIFANFPLCFKLLKVLSLRWRLRLGLWESGCRRVQIRCRPKVLCGTEWLGDISLSHFYISLRSGDRWWVILVDFSIIIIHNPSYHICIRNTYSVYQPMFHVI